MTNRIVSIVSIVSIASIVSIVSIAPIEAQAQEGNYRFADATQLWRLTDNAAGLTIDAAATRNYNRGFAEFDMQHREGDYRRVQEGGQRNQLTFHTERYQHVGHYLVGYGKFHFDMDRTKDRAWCDVMRPYNSNPFFGGSSVHGKYDTQQFDLTAALGTIDFSGFRFGSRLDYKVGDLSRLRDPRSRSELLQYRLTPAITYSNGSHTIGLSGHYDRRKEKIPNMTTVQQDPNLMYYQMTGMEQATGLIGGYSGYNREWVNHQFGAQLAYGYNKTRLSTASSQFSHFNSLTTLGIAHGVEDVWGTYKYEPGRYTSYIYNIASHNRLNTGRLLHQLDLDVAFTEGYADEYRQLLIQERDAEKGYTSYHYETQIEYRKRYQVKTHDATLHYRLSTLSGTAIRGYVGAATTLQGASNKHLLPTSQLEYQRQNFSFESGYAFFKNHLWLDATVTYSHASKADIDIASPQQTSNTYASEVLIPDMAYYSADYWRGQLSLKYEFPFSLKGSRSTAFVKAYADGIKADDDLDRTTVGLSFGLYY